LASIPDPARLNWKKEKKKEGGKKAGARQERAQSRLKQGEGRKKKQKRSMIKIEYDSA